MAAQFKNLIVNVFNDSGEPLANAAVTLIGTGTPQVLPTGANGQCTFSTLPPGNYKLMIAREGFNTRATSVTHTDTAETSVRIIMKVVDEESPARSRIFQLLTALQYLFLGLLALGFAWVLYKGIDGHDLDLSKTEAARGLITYVVAVVTVAIGLILVMSAAFLSGSKDMEKRFAFGKDVFTILVGVLGTVMGFYYGQSAAKVPTAETIQIAAAKVDPAAPKVGSEFTLTANITGGEVPYAYTVTFSNPAAITGDLAGKSADGKINQKFSVASTASPGQAITYTIDVTDKNGLKGTSDKGTFTPTPTQ